MRKFLIVCSLWLGLTAGVFATETFTLTDGSSVAGDIVKSDDATVMIHTTSDAYSTVPWGQFSQDTLKQLAANPKYKPYAEPFIEPTAPVRSAKSEIHVTAPARMASPEGLHPSIIGGLLHSSLGLFLLLVIYVANLYAAYEVAVVRGKPVPLVVAVSVLLPIIGPIIFLSQSMTSQSAPEEAVVEEPLPGETPKVPVPGAPQPQDEVQIESASWKAEEARRKAAEPQIFNRGKFTFNKRFIETKFAGFVGEPKGEGKKFAMELKTGKGTFAVECIKQVGLAEAILETPNGQVSVSFADIQEIKLTPKTV